MATVDELFGIETKPTKIDNFENIDKKNKTPDINLTQWLNSINFDKTYLMNRENESKYPQYVINMCLSKHRDLIFYIDALNNFNISNKMHYDFLLNAVSEKKRWSPFSKKQKNIEDVELVKKYFNVSYNRALEYYLKLTSEDIENIKKIFDEGGLKTKVKKK